MTTISAPVVAVVSCGVDKGKPGSDLPVKILDWKPEYFLGDNNIGPIIKDLLKTYKIDEGDFKKILKVILEKGLFKATSKDMETVQKLLKSFVTGNEGLISLITFIPKLVQSGMTKLLADNQRDFFDKVSEVAIPLLTKKLFPTKTAETATEKTDREAKAKNFSDSAKVFLEKLLFEGYKDVTKNGKTVSAKMQLATDIINLIHEPIIKPKLSSLLSSLDPTLKSVFQQVLTKNGIILLLNKFLGFVFMPSSKIYNYDKAIKWLAKKITELEKKYASSSNDSKKKINDLQSKINILNKKSTQLSAANTKKIKEHENEIKKLEDALQDSKDDIDISKNKLEKLKISKQYESDHNLNNKQTLSSRLFQGVGLLNLSKEELSNILYKFQDVFGNLDIYVKKTLDTMYPMVSKYIKQILRNPMFRKLSQVDLIGFSPVLYKLLHKGLKDISPKDIMQILSTLKAFAKIPNLTEKHLVTLLNILKDGMHTKKSTYKDKEDLILFLVKELKPELLPIVKPLLQKSVHTP